MTNTKHIGNKKDKYNPHNNRSTLQISSPWKPPAINKLPRTASVLICVWVNPSKRLPGCFYYQQAQKGLVSFLDSKWSFW